MGIYCGARSDGTPGEEGVIIAHAEKRIERLAPELDQIISPAEPIRELAEGFGGALGPAEGPLWWKEGGYLLFDPDGDPRLAGRSPQNGTTPPMPEIVLFLTALRCRRLSRGDQSWNPRATCRRPRERGRARPCRA